MRRLFVLSLLLVVAGCAAIDKKPYPTGWPSAMVASQSCRSINGDYESRALTHTYAHPNREHLLALTLLRASVDYRSIETVSVEYEEKRLHAIGYAADGASLVEKTYTAESGFFSCEDGVLIIQPDKAPTHEQAPDNPLVGFSRSEIALSKATDGSLIMRMSGSATGLAFLVIPAHVATEDWYRFAPVRGD